MVNFNAQKPYKININLPNSNQKGASQRECRVYGRLGHKAATEVPNTKLASVREDDFLPNVMALAKEGRLTQSIIEQRDKVSRLEGRHRLELNKKLVSTVHKAYFLQSDRDAWIDLCRHPEWEGVRNRPKPDDNSDPLRAVLRLSCGLQDKAGHRKASLLYKALQPVFRLRVHPLEILQLLETEGGISGLAEKHRERDKQLKGLTEDGVYILRVLLGNFTHALAALGPETHFLGDFVVKANGDGVADVDLVAFSGPPKRP